MMVVHNSLALGFHIELKFRVVIDKIDLLWLGLYDTPLN